MQNKFIIIGVAVIVVVIGVLAFLANGKAVPDTTSAVKNAQPSAVIVPFTKLVEGTKSAVAKRTNYLITSSTELKDLWKLIDATSTPPTIDFTTNAVIAVFAGKETPSSIAIAKIEDNAARTVSISLTKPEGACSEKVAATSSYEIAVVPVTSLPFAHEDIVATTVCPK